MSPEIKAIQQSGSVALGGRAGRDRTSGTAAPGRGLDRQAGQVEDSIDLSPDAQKEVARLKARDREVRAHEAAHMAAGAGVVRGGASYSYQRGPDGQMYANGGEVSIDASPVPDDPQATLLKAQRIRSAAMAPADPSPQDRAVAAAAARMAASAASEISRKAFEKAQPAEGPKPEDQKKAPVRGALMDVMG